MENTLKYDPLQIHRTGNAKSAAIEKLISIKIETDLEDKLQILTKRLIDTDDNDLLLQISAEIKNIQKDIEDLKRARHQHTLKHNDSSAQIPEFIKITVDV